jgi:Inorganic Pyrophosphatase
MADTSGPWNQYKQPGAEPSAAEDGPWSKYGNAIPPQRTVGAALNDTVIEFANAAAGGLSSAGNFVAPGNAASQWIDKNIVEAGEAKQSDMVKAEKQQFRDRVDKADGVMDELGAVGSYVMNNPVLSAAQAAGSFVTPGAAVKAVGTAGRAAGLGAKGGELAGRAGGVAAGAALAGGDAAGTAYDLSKKGGATEDQAVAAGRQASVIPALVGGAGGAFGAEKLLAGGKGFAGGAVSRAVKHGASEALQEGVEEGVTQYEGQRAAMPYDPSIDPMKGVAAAAGMGAVLGGMTGGGVSLLTGGHGAAEQVPAGQEGQADLGGAEVAQGGEVADAAAPPAASGLDPVHETHAAQLQDLQAQEQGEDLGPQSEPPDGAAAPAAQRAQAQAQRQAEMEASRAVESPDDEIYQSTGAAEPPRSVQMGLNPAAGPLSAGAALAVDSGAADQMQQALAAAQAAQAEGKGMKAAADAGAPRAQEPARSSPDTAEVDLVTGELAPQGMAAWSDTQLSAAFRSAQSRPVRIQLAQELARRRADRGEPSPTTAARTAAAAAAVPAVPETAAPTPGEQQAQQIARESAEARRQRQLGASERWTRMTDAERQAAAAQAQGLNVVARRNAHTRTWADLNEKHRAALMDVLAPRIPAPTTTEGSTNGPEASQAQQAAAQPAQAGAAPAAAAEGLNDGSPTSSNAGAQAAPAAGAQAAQEGRAQRAERIDRAGEAWTRMRAAERQAVASRLEGVKPVILKNLKGAQWANLNADLKRKIADAMEPAAEAALQPQSAIDFGAPTSVGTAAQDAATNPANDLPEPTAAQKEAGNYRKGHVRLNGHDISIENPAGSRRRPEWPPLQNHYGYIKGTKGADKDHVDVFMTDRAHEPDLPVFVVDQVNKDGSFDEHKVVMGAADEAEARSTYLGNYAKGWTGLGAITQMTQDEFKAWVLDPAQTKKPAAKTIAASAQLASDAAGQSPSSWVIREKATGAVIAETFDRKKVAALNTEKYEAVPIREHLASLSAKPADQVPVKKAEPAPARPAVEPAAAEQQAIKSHGLPADTGFTPGKGALGSGKWVANSGKHSGSLSSTVEEAAQSLATFIKADAERADASAHTAALAGEVATKLKRGEQPSDVELRDLFGLAPNHTYVEQSAVGQFLVEHMGVQRNGIRKALGAAAGDRTSDGGSKYPIVYPRKLHQVFGPQAAPVSVPERMKRAKAEKAAAAARGMTDEGRAADGGPIMPGDTFATSSGRTTSPYPKQKGERYASQWLIDNAVAEAESRGDTFNSPTFQATKLLKSGQLTDGDRESMLMYLFGEQPAVVPGVLKPLVAAAESAGVASNDTSRRPSPRGCSTATTRWSAASAPARWIWISSSRRSTPWCGTRRPPRPRSASSARTTCCAPAATASPTATRVKRRT